MSDQEIINKGRETVLMEAEALKAMSGRIDGSFVKAVNCIFECKGRTILTGIGKSGLIARKIVATFNSTGTPSLYLHPTDALHGDLGMVRKEDVIILISKSGNTEELVQLLTMLKRLDLVLIGMVGNMSSKISRGCDLNLDVSVEEEACPYDLAPTSSTTAALAMGDALAMALWDKRDFTPRDFARLHPGGSLGKRLSLRIQEIMIKGDGIPKVSEDTSLKDTIYEISSKRLGTTCVLNSEGKLSGIITDGDLRRLMERTMDIKSLVARDVMSKNPKTIQKESLASLALQEMEQFKITSLVVAGESLIPEGVIHLHDLVDLGLEVR